MGAHGGAPLLNRLACRGRPPCLPCQTEAQLKHKYEKLSCSKTPLTGQDIQATCLLASRTDAEIPLIFPEFARNTHLPLDIRLRNRVYIRRLLNLNGLVAQIA